METILPLKNPKPDAHEFIAILSGKHAPTRTPLIEYIIDEAHLKRITVELCNREWVEFSPDKTTRKRYWDNYIEVWYRLGYDFVRLELGLDFPRKVISGEDKTTAIQTRAWADEHNGAIANWEDCETYPWPKVESADLSDLEYISTHLPDGMGLMTNHAAGPFEVVTQILSYEKFCFMLFDQPELLAAIVTRVGDLMEAYYQRLVQLPNLIALFQGDDMGFRSGTLVAPDVLRSLFLPIHKRFGKIAHHQGIPYFLHSCGELSSLYEQLISDVEIDGKHSFEDAILPAEVFQARYENRIATLGGVDVHLLTRGTKEQVKARTLHLLSTCGAHGRYAIGSGNSIPSYVPLENYLTMVHSASSYW